MQEEWAVVIVEGCALNTVATSAKGAPVLRDEPQRMVGICQVGRAVHPVTICDDEAEAFRVAEAVSQQLHLPLYDGVDRQALQIDADEYLDLEADGPDPYPQHRNVTNRWAVVVFHDERYAETDFPCVVNLDDGVYEPDYIVSRHPTQEAAYIAAEAMAARCGLQFPVEPGQVSIDVPAGRYRAARETSALIPGGRGEPDPPHAAGAGAGHSQLAANVRTRRTAAPRRRLADDRGTDR